MRRINAIAAMTAAALALASCGGGSDSDAGSDQLTVFAAASLTEVFPTIDRGARYSFAGSDDLASQIRAGAPADVFAAASPKYTQQLFDEGLVEEPVTFAANRLVLIVPKSNPAGIGDVEDVTRPGTKLVVAQEGVPVGDYTREVLGELGLTAALDNVVSNEDDVKAVLSKVSLGEADAGFVYATDAAVAGDDVEIVELPEGSQPPIEYQIAVVKGSGDEAAAQTFVDAVLAGGGQHALEAAGFVVP
jgi:molybdate transport system substrate-binding protein